MEILNQLLVKHSFGELAEREFKDIIEMFKEFFLMIKEVTYDVAVAALGGEVVGVILVCVLALGIMIACMAIINR